MTLHRALLAGSRHEFHFTFPADAIWTGLQPVLGYPTNVPPSNLSDLIQGWKIDVRVGDLERTYRTGIRENSPRTVPSHVFELFPVLKEMLRRRGGDLSGGQQQQLAIARALVLEPTLLILDEPTEGIQPNIVHEIGDVILKLNREAGTTVLLVEQKLPFAHRVASGFTILDKGRVVASGPIGELTDGTVRAHLSV